MCHIRRPNSPFSIFIEGHVLVYRVYQDYSESLQHAVCMRAQIKAPARPVLAALHPVSLRLGLGNDKRLDSISELLQPGVQSPLGLKPSE